MKAIISVFFLLAIHFPVNAALFFSYDTTVIHSCFLSAKHQNRVFFEGNRIAKVMYPEGCARVQIEEETGQVFIQAGSRSLPEITISIITLNGHVQDFEIVFDDRPAEIVIIEELIENTPVDFSFAPVSHAEFTSANIVACIKSNQIPDGYISYDVYDEDYFIQGVKARTVSKLIGPNEMVILLILENRTGRKICLQESDFGFLQGQWVYLEKKSLRARESTLAIVSINIL